MNRRNFLVGAGALAISPLVAQAAMQSNRSKLLSSMTAMLAFSDTMAEMKQMGNDPTMPRGMTSPVFHIDESPFVSFKQYSEADIRHVYEFAKKNGIRVTPENPSDLFRPIPKHWQ